MILKKGDKIRCIKSSTHKGVPSIIKGKIYTVKEVDTEEDVAYRKKRYEGDPKNYAHDEPIVWYKAEDDDEYRTTGKHISSFENYFVLLKDERKKKLQKCFKLAQK